MHPKHLLEQAGIDPKKSLGQNFLFDDALLARITAAAELSSEDTVLEIGPGLGALTKHLAAAAERVVAVELDQRLLPVLEAQLAGRLNVDLVHADILDLDPSDWFEGSYVVVANVPYYITGAILRHLLSESPRPRRLVMTVQKEVADRLTAEPPDMSLLAVSVQYYGDVRTIATVKAGAFWPRPDVDSAVIRVDVTADAGSAADDNAFFRVARAGFSQKRKQLKNNLKTLDLSREEIETALAETGIDGRRRAETLTVDEWRVLAARLA